jgi:hypothetical protein
MWVHIRLSMSLSPIDFFESPATRAPPRWGHAYPIHHRSPLQSYMPHVFLLPGPSPFASNCRRRDRRCDHAGGGGTRPLPRLSRSSPSPRLCPPWPTARLPRCRRIPSRTQRRMTRARWPGQRGRGRGAVLMVWSSVLVRFCQRRRRLMRGSKTSAS